MSTIGMLIVGMVLSGEPFKVEPRPESVPLPVPLVEPTSEPNPNEKPELPSDQAGNAATGISSPGAHDGRHAPADPRPKVYVHTVHRKDRSLPSLCGPCDAFDEWWLVNCDASPFNIIPIEYESFDALPQWVAKHGVPLLQRQSEATPTGWACETWNGPEALERNWNAANPGARLRLLAGRGAAEMLAGSPMFEQVIKYLPDGTRITIELPRPMKVMLEDRTSLSYSKITGKLATANGKARLTLDQPKPIVEAWKGVRWLNLGTTFGAQLDFFEFEDTTPPSVGVGTNRGMYRFVMEPQK